MITLTGQSFERFLLHVDFWVSRLFPITPECQADVPYASFITKVYIEQSFFFTFLPFLLFMLFYLVLYPLFIKVGRISFLFLS